MAKLEDSGLVSVVDKPHDCPVAVCANAYDTSALYQSGGADPIANVEVSLSHNFSQQAVMQR